MNASTLCAFTIGVIALVGADVASPGPIESGRHAYPDHAQTVHEAEHAVDQAWEVYHRAALGGTVASPALQADIEQHLHEARTLVTQAQEAAAHGDVEEVVRLVEQITMHASRAIIGSKEQKP